ncbi:PepSY-associated TM helix domain-containing protein [Flavobacterium aquicola]|uniref:Putative iron-regulated membrane protein n=1 Tax=Flavobacterium aquicola TaxID=1682742 RepID=A0A3E0EMS9_9FLAO|nr:PepSY-associated TM helix domain-containing protein [Flavobacterium aquicola]REG99488.1 putative iron-regulated membrane protein [Flavobacterium aquicola]
MSKRVKKIISQIHLWLGLASGLIVFIVALTGSILVFEEEIEEILHPEFYTVTSIAKEKKAIDYSIEILEKKYSIKTINRIYTYNDPKRTSLVMAKDSNDETQIFAINPYTGKIIDKVTMKSRFFSIVNNLHRNLLMGETGKLITGYSCLIFVVLLISGLFLWWPKKIKTLKQRLIIKWKASFKRVNWDFHSTLGFYSFLFLLIISLTGLTWSFKWFENTIYYFSDGTSKKTSVTVENPTKTEPKLKNTVFYQTILDVTNRVYPFKGDIQIRMPKDTINSIFVTKENLEKNIPNQSSIAYFDKYTAEIFQIKPYESFTLGDKIRRIIFPLHTGSILVYPTKIIAFLVCLIAATAPITGFLIWIGRKKKKNHF